LNSRNKGMADIARHVMGYDLINTWGFIVRVDDVARKFTRPYASVIASHTFLEAKRYVDDAEHAEEEEYAKMTADGREFRPSRTGKDRFQAVGRVVAAARRISMFMHTAGPTTYLFVPIARLLGKSTCTRIRRT
jgi:hypothetical protein